MIYKKKITAQLGWLRPVERREPLMRLICLVEEGWEEASQFGFYIRWVGKFKAQVVQRDGTISEYASRNLIIPSLASDMIAASFSVEEKGEVKTGARTGRHFRPTLEGALEVFNVFDVWLIPPSGDRVSQTGYEYEVSSVLPDTQDDMFARLTHDVPAYNAPALAASPVSEEPSPAPAVEAEPPPAEEHKSGRKRHAA